MCLDQQQPRPLPHFLRRQQATRTSRHTQEKCQGRYRRQRFSILPLVLLNLTASFSLREEHQEHCRSGSKTSAAVGPVVPFIPSYGKTLNRVIRLASTVHWWILSTASAMSTRSPALADSESRACFAEELGKWQILTRCGGRVNFLFHDVLSAHDRCTT